MAKMMNRNRKKSRYSFSPFTNCPCCTGPTAYGRAAEKRQWQKEQHTIKARSATG